MVSEDTSGGGFGTGGELLISSQDQGDRRLQRLFSAFPGGWPGIGLLLLRTSLGTTAVVQSILYLSRSGDFPLGVWAAAVLTVASGAALAAGLFTPLAALLIGGCAACVAGVSGPSLTTLFAVVIGIALACLGPGAFSVDAHLFGRREIIIPK